MNLQTALAHHRAGRLAQAVAIYQQILEANPNDSEALHWLGNAAGQLGEIDLAVTLLAKAHTLAPRNAQYLLSLGAMHRARQAYEPSLACYEQALALQPGSGAACYGKGMALQRLGRTQDAMAALRKALALAPNHAQATLSLAYLLRETGELDEAARHYRQAIATTPALASAHYGLGIA
ncbi:MAG TPA: tetratricopeptide repeat protein, partial [Bordetella sp.]